MAKTTGIGELEDLTISDLDPKEDKFTLSDLFDDVDESTDIGDGISISNIPDPQGFWAGLGATGVDLLRDWRNNLAMTGEGITTLMPGVNTFAPEFFSKAMYKDPEGDVSFPLQGDWKDIFRGIGNELYAPSEVHANNPYKNMFSNIRTAGNILPLAASVLGSRGTVGLPYLTSKLPPSLQKIMAQVLPIASGKGKWASRNLREGNFLRNAIASFATNRKAIPNYLTQDYSNKAGAANAAEPNRISDSFRSDPVVFDDYVQDRMNNLRNQRTVDQGPGPRDNYRGL